MQSFLDEAVPDPENLIPNMLVIYRVRNDWLILWIIIYDIKNLMYNVRTSQVI